MTSITAAKSPPLSASTACQSSSWIKNRNVFSSPHATGGSVAHDAVAEAPRSPLELQRHSMLTCPEKGERLDGEMHSINLFIPCSSKASALRSRVGRGSLVSSARFVAGSPKSTIKRSNSYAVCSYAWKNGKTVELCFRLGDRDSLVCHTPRSPASQVAPSSQCACRRDCGCGQRLMSRSPEAEKMVVGANPAR